MLRKVSWILLTLEGVAVVVISLLSASVAYRRVEDRIGPVSLVEVAAGREDVATALRARRGTAAAYAAAYGTLFLAVILVPYRRGDAWSWWAILLASLVLLALSLLRVPALDTQAGVGPIMILFGLTVVALLLDVGRLKG